MKCLLQIAEACHDKHDGKEKHGGNAEVLMEESSNSWSRRDVEIFTGFARFFLFQDGGKKKPRSKGEKGEEERSG